MITAVDVANTIVLKAQNEGASLSHTKLQKLTYMVYACYFAKTGVQLFSDRFEKLEKGPVSPSVYVAFYNRLGEKHIRRPASQGEGGIRVLESKGILGECLDLVWNRFGGKSTDELVNKTHETGSAWKKCEFDGNLLNDEDIKSDGERWFLDDCQK
ncbi:MAG: SocA family protein [Oscillospiraceae bacterium]|nr:SocA family protein [Oscillospiraceae bacterium]